MSFRVFNTLTRRLEEVTPADPGGLRLYTCGPTVYDYAHIGNFRAYLFEDLLRRHLEWSGFPVRHVMNLTDVDDKTIRGARQKNVPLAEFTRPFIAAFFEDIDTLHIRRAHLYPAATEHVPDMIALIGRLLDKGVAYRSEDGSVYFNIGKFPNYGRLARLDLAGLRPGARVAQDEYEKEHVGDFALWKAWDEADGAVGWEAPWGRGRPGWHIECSAMSMKHLGESFDIHCGGIDNIFPHHEDEIAQSEAATGRPFVRYWMHCAHLVVNGEKMSKSLGNFYTLRDLLGRGYRGREIRYALIATHYRQTLNFTLEGLDGARAALRRLDEFQERLEARAGNGGDAAAEPGWVEQARTGFRAALDDDLNISEALAALFDMVHAGHKALDAGGVSAGDARAALRRMGEMDEVLGFLKADAGPTDAEVLELLQRRAQARQARDWAAADRVRDELKARGWTVQDTAQGPKLKKI
jgi:cysteinyl-tRNA synthetase